MGELYEDNKTLPVPVYRHPVFQQPLWDWDARHALQKQAHSIQHSLSPPAAQPSIMLFAQCKWFSSFLALSTPLPANLPASLKLNFPSLLAAIHTQPEPIAQNRHAGALLLVGLHVPPATVRGSMTCCALGTPTGAGLV